MARFLLAGRVGLNVVVEDPKKAFLLELRTQYLAVGRALCADFGVYFSYPKELVYKWRTAAH